MESLVYLPTSTPSDETRKIVTKSLRFRKQLQILIFGRTPVNTSWALEPPSPQLMISSNVWSSLREVLVVDVMRRKLRGSLAHVFTIWDFACVRGMRGEILLYLLCIVQRKRAATAYGCHWHVETAMTVKVVLVRRGQFVCQQRLKNTESSESWRIPWHRLSCSGFVVAP